MCLTGTFHIGRDLNNDISVKTLSIACCIYDPEYTVGVAISIVIFKILSIVVGL